MKHQELVMEYLIRVINDTNSSHLRQHVGVWIKNICDRKLEGDNKQIIITYLEIKSWGDVYA